MKDERNIAFTQSAFTLVEMLIAIVLSSIIFVSAYQVISNLVQYQVRAQVQQNGYLDKALLTNLISHIIEKGINQYDLFYRVQKDMLFRGEGDSLQLISRAFSEYYDQPGHRVYRIYHRDDELFVSYRGYDQDYLSNEQTELATGLKIDRLGFEYFEDGDWVDEWSDEDSIPSFIRVTVDQPGLGRTELVRSISRR